MTKDTIVFQNLGEMQFLKLTHDVVLCTVAYLSCKHEFIAEVNLTVELTLEYEINTLKFLPLGVGIIFK